MILVVIGQVAGAEYLLPLFKYWQEKTDSEWRVFAVSSCVSLLSKEAIPHTLIDDKSDAMMVEGIIDVIAPDQALLSTSTGGIEKTFVKVLQKKGVFVTQFIDYWANYLGRFKDHEAGIILPDRIFTIDPVAVDEMVDEGVICDVVEVIGQPHYESFIRSHPIRDLGKQVLLLTQPVFQAHEKRLGYDQWDFVSIVLKELREISIPGERIDIQIHPVERLESYQAVAGEVYSDIHYFESGPVDWSKYCLVIGMFSSVQVHSLLVGVPTLAVQPGAQGPDLCVLSRRGWIPRITVTSGFAQELAVYIDDGFMESQREGRSRLNALVSGSIDRLIQYYE